MQQPPGRWWRCLLWWMVVAAAAATAAAAPDPVVGSAQVAARPRYKGRTSEGRYGRTHATIVTGKYATTDRFPYQVYLRIFLRNGTVDFCGGAIIGVRHILTAAHCIDKPNVIKKLAVIGSMHRFGRRAMNFTVTHQTFYPKKSWENVDADIAVIMVDQSMPLGEKNVKLARLQNNRSFNRRILCSVAGWGDSRDNLDPDILKFVKVPIVKRKKCAKSYPHDPPDDLLCAGFYEKGGPDTCQGDSGGPLMCGGLLTGIVKGGVGCGLPHYPGTYTDVSYYWSWVESVMIEDWKMYFKSETPSPIRRKWKLFQKADRFSDSVVFNRVFNRSATFQ